MEMKILQISIPYDMYEEMLKYKKITGLSLSEQARIAMAHYLVFFTENEGVYDERNGSRK